MDRTDEQWVVLEPLIAWLGNFHRLVAHYERHTLKYLGFVHLGSILILLRSSL